MMYLIGIVAGALLLSVFVYRWRKSVEESRRDSESYYSIAVYEPGRDPFEERIEFHCRKR